jgi:hypothetical protein
VQESELSRRERDLAWALSLDSVVEVEYPPKPFERATSAAELSRLGDQPLPTSDSSPSSAASPSPVPRPRIISNPDHWMPDRFFERGLRVVSMEGADTSDLPSVGDLRHGITYERYLRRWFDLDPEVEVLAQGLEIRSSRTLGQFDFLLRWEDQVYHLEVAIKFYLRLGGPDALDRYVGSDLRDRLDHKVAHMLFRQRRLREHRETLAELRARRLPVPGRAVASIRGVIYPPLPETVTGVPARWWATSGEWERRADLRRLHWTVVGPSQWFSPLRHQEASWVPGSSFDPRWYLPTPGRALCIAGIEPDSPERGESTRGFIVRNVV